MVPCSPFIYLFSLLLFHCSTSYLVHPKHHTFCSSTMDSMGFLFHPLSLTTVLLSLTIFITGILRHGWLLGNRRRHPISGTVFHLLLNLNRMYHYLTDLASKQDSYRFLHLFRSMVYTTDPANVEYVLKTNFPNYCKGWYHRRRLSDLLGEGIFTVDKEQWQHQRKVSSYEFSSKVLRDFSSTIFRRNAAKLAHVLSEAAASNQSMEIQDLFMKSALDSVFKVILGIELDSMCGTNEEGVQFSKAFDEASKMTQYRYLDIFWEIKRFLNVGNEAVLKDNIKVIDEFVYKVIRSKKEQTDKSQEPSTTVRRGDILSRFLELKETDPKYLRDIILNFIIAGKDTTAITLSWFIYLLCKHPLIQEKVAREVREATRVEGTLSFDEIADSITEEALDKMQYLHAALTETLRLYPPVPVDGKLCLSDDAWPDGFSVRKGDVVFYVPYTMGRMKSLWGDDAEAFRPERWLNEDGVFQLASSFKFIAFNAGPRICLGKEFAYRQMKIFSAALLASYAFKLSDEKREANYMTNLTLHIDGGLHVQASFRTH